MTNVKLDDGLIQGDYDRFGADRGGIDECWFGSTTDAANDGRVWHEGQSFCLFEGKKFMLKQAIAERGADMVGESIFGKYDRWPVYSKFFDNTGPIPHHMHQQLFSAEELTVAPGAKCTLKDPGASSWITVQGRGRMGSLDLQTPAMIRFGENTSDEVFISHVAATGGVEVENLGTELLVGLRYFGPDTHSDLPKAGS